MSDFFNTVIQSFSAQSPLETIAVVCAILYLVLMVRENIWCWFFAFISTSIYIYLFYQEVLFSESLLNVFYLIMAVYGWLQWSKGIKDNELKIHHRPLSFHLKVLALLAVMTPLWGFFMASLGADFPYLDAFVAMASVLTTFMVIYKVFENWYYWLLIDSLSIYIFWQKGFYLTVFLYAVYIVLIFVGIYNWKKLMQKQNA